MNSRKVQVGTEHYDFIEYVNRRRWNSYYSQIEEILSFSPGSVLEVGVGAGILGTILKQIGLHYESLDIDSKIEPDHIGSVLELPFIDNSYDVVACFQVLEHMEYQYFSQALSELYRVAKGAVVLSLPDAKRVWPYYLKLPKVGEVKFLMPKPRLRTPTHKFNGQHYWVVNKKGYSSKKIENTINNVGEKYGFALNRSYRLWENPNHRFFIAGKKE
ncbi:MAG: class I SAM-dependent methyltransferase [Spirochaetaceae bacterium]|nr:class I SAM-dependent methyltransferase [Spirochaetaceae bacterium]MCF7949353.1 class I SAM-dependent methyltransferase [Spirochaetia bacterium]